jgi:phytoene dehydrogenase-like protein
MHKEILIIGAGIAGLSAGIFAQKNGYRTQIFELHDLPGGLCTAWERNGYIFDGCIHYLFGSAPGKPFNQVWQELGVIQDLNFIHHKEFMRVVDLNGPTAVAYCDPEQLRDHLMRLISPFSGGDLRRVQDLAEAVRRFESFDMALLYEKPRALMNPVDWAGMGLLMTPFLSPLLKWGRSSAASFADGFQEPFLRRVFHQIFGWPEIPMMAAIALLSYMHLGNAGFPAGGSLAFARRLEKRYLELGGQIHYKSQVQKILVKGGKAVGVQLYNDEEVFGDVVISAADAHGTLQEWLAGQYIHKDFQKLFSGNELPIRTQVQVSLGVNRDLSQEPHWVTYLLDRPVEIAGQAHAEIGIKHYCFDPSLAPAGKSCLVVMLPSPYGYWQRIYGRKYYDTEQLQVADQVISQVEKVYPGIRADIEVTDVATPLSFERYTGNWQGSTCGWLPSIKTMRYMFRGIKKTLPGLDNFYMAGQWVEPGGSLPFAAASARNVIWTICAQDGKPFVTQA